jgi:hypothetical protein
MDLMTKYQVNIEYLKKEFGLDDFTSLYELVNRTCDAYRALKQNQSKEIENGTRTESRRKRIKAS